MTDQQLVAPSARAVTGFVANFAQEVMKWQLPWSVEGLRGQGIELFSHSEAVVPGLDHHLSLLNHVHELNTNERTLGGVERLEP